MQVILQNILSKKPYVDVHWRNGSKKRKNKKKGHLLKKKTELNKYRAPQAYYSLSVLPLQKEEKQATAADNAAG